MTLEEPISEKVENATEVKPDIFSINETSFLTNLKNISWLLGYYLDGWAELIEGMGDQVTEVQNHLVNQLNVRNMPEILVDKTTIREGFISNSTRPYTETKTNPGARTFISINKHGTDLYCSWRSFIRPTINWQLILIYAVISLSISLILVTIFYVYSFFNTWNYVWNNWNWAYSQIIFFSWVIMGFVISLIWGLIMSFLSLFRKGYKSYIDSTPFQLGFLYAFFINGFGKTILDGIKNFFSQIETGLRSNSNPYPIIPLTFYFFSGFLGLAALLGLILRKNIWTFILKEPSIFDAEDITAMNLSVHKSLIRALDCSGIDISKLRIKQKFSSGRRGEDL